MKNTRRSLALLAALALPLTLAACSSSEPSTPSSEKSEPSAENAGKDKAVGNEVIYELSDPSATAEPGQSLVVRRSEAMEAENPNSTMQAYTLTSRKADSPEYCAVDVKIAWRDGVPDWAETYDRYPNGTVPTLLSNGEKAQRFFSVGEELDTPNEDVHGPNEVELAASEDGRVTRAMAIGQKLFSRSEFAQPMSRLNFDEKGIFVSDDAKEAVLVVACSPDPKFGDGETKLSFPEQNASGVGGASWEGSVSPEITVTSDGRVSALQ